MLPLPLASPVSALFVLSFFLDLNLSNVNTEDKEQERLILVSILLFITKIHTIYRFEIFISKVYIYI